MIGNDFFEGKVTLPIILLYQKLDEKKKKYLKTIFEKEERNTDDLKFVHTSGLLVSTDILWIIEAKSGGVKSSKYPLSKTNPTHNSFSVLIEPTDLPISVNSKFSKQPN